MKKPRKKPSVHPQANQNLRKRGFLVKTESELGYPRFYFIQNQIDSPQECFLDSKGIRVRFTALSRSQVEGGKGNNSTTHLLDQGRCISRLLGPNMNMITLYSTRYWTLYLSAAPCTLGRYTFIIVGLFIQIAPTMRMFSISESRSSIQYINVSRGRCLALNMDWIRTSANT